MNVPDFDFHSLQGFNPRRYSVRVNGPWCITFEFEDGEACRVEFEQYHKGATMASAANRCKNHCPTHPGALLRDDVLPATGRTKAEIAGLLGISRQRLYDILQERKRYRQPPRFGSASFLAMARESGRGCRPPTTRGMRSGPKTSVAFQRSRRAPPKLNLASNRILCIRGFVAVKSMLPGGLILQDQCP